MDNKTRKELMENIKQRNNLEKEFQQRKRFHKLKLGLGDDAAAQDVAETLALLDMERGDTHNLDQLPSSTNTKEGEALEKLAAMNPDAVLNLIDREVPRKRKRPTTKR